MQTSDCLGGQVIESFTQVICSKILIHSGMKQLAVLMPESLNHSLSWFRQKQWFVQEWNKRLFMRNHWVINSTDLFSNNSVTVKKWLSLWANHWIIDSTDSLKNTDLFRYETSDCRYEQIIESLTQPIHLKTLICSDMKQVSVVKSKWLPLWANHWVIDSIDSLKNTDLFRYETSDCRYE